MDWEKIIGQKALQKQLIDSIDANRVGHAYLFTGNEGYGALPLALAFAKEIFLRENPDAASKIEHLNHVDLHFSFPVFTENRKSVSSKWFATFREMVLENPYFSLDDWMNYLDSANKQFFISTAEIEEQIEHFTLKSFEGGSKILIVWRADKMNVAAANKLLKFLEEPPEKTIILMTANSVQDLLPTILSRVQIVEIPRITDEDLMEKISTDFQTPSLPIPELIAKAQGDCNLFLKLKNGTENEDFEALFIQWVREAFQVRKRPEKLKNIILWARNIAGWNREKQKSFLAYCAEMFRLAMMQNYGQSDLVYKKIESTGFQWETFSTFIHGANIEDIITQLSETDYHLERNGNPKIIWTDMGIKLSRYIHKK